MGREGLKKRLLLSVVGGIILLLSLGNIGWAVPIARIDVFDSPIYLGEQFRIDIIAQDVESMDAVLAFGMDLDFHSTWNLDSVVMGDGFFDDSAFWPDTDVAGSAMPAIGGGEDILLTSLYFTPHQAGTFDFGIISDITVYSEGLFTFEYSPPYISQVDITTATSVSVSPAPIPEPSSGLLILLGSVIIGCIYNKRKVF